MDVIQRVLADQGIDFELREIQMGLDSKMRQTALKIADKILLTLNAEHKVAYLEWSAGSNEDTYVEMLVALLTKYSVSPSDEPQATHGQQIKEDVS